jgi:hypothetical protein
MRMIARVACVAGLALCVSPSAFAGERSMCAPGGAMRGMNERIDALRDQMDRIDRTEDRAKQRDMMDLHMKLMQEGMREIRNRDLRPECRMEMMTSMMEVMLRHQHAMHDPQDRR